MDGDKRVNFTIVQAFNTYHTLLGNVFREEKEWKTNYGKERTGFNLKEEQRKFSK